jgi:hypothetical protein
MRRLGLILPRVLAGLWRQGDRKKKAIRGQVCAPKEESARVEKATELAWLPPASLHALAGDAVTPPDPVVRSSRSGAPEGRKPRVRV